MNKGKAIGSVFGTLGLAAVLAFALSGWVKGQVFALMWDKESTLSCGGDFVMTIEDETIEMPGGTALSAGGNCELEIVNSTIKAGRVVTGGGNAQITIQGGRIEGSEAAIDLGGNAVVEVDGAEIVGPVETGGNARVNGLPEDDEHVADQVDATTQDEEAAHKAAICGKLVEPCYEQHEAWGNVSGRVVANVASNGTVEESSYQGDAPAEVQDCLLKAMKERAIEGYDGDPVKVTCQYSGSITDGTRMLMTDWKLEPRQSCDRMISSGSRGRS